MLEGPVSHQEADAADTPVNQYILILVLDVLHNES